MRQATVNLLADMGVQPGTLQSGSSAATAWADTTGPAAAITAPAAGATVQSGSPTTPADPDTAGTEIGIRFRADVAGQVTAIRFDKSSGNTGTHVGRLWTNTGTQLAAVTFTGESASGWQQATLATPVTVSPGTTYVVSYFAPNGRYAADTNYFRTQGVTSAPLRALRDGEDGVNGVYRYGTGFPALAWGSANYYVDVVFTPVLHGLGVTTGTRLLHPPT